LTGASENKAGRLSAADVAMLRTIHDNMRVARQTDEVRGLIGFAHEVKCALRDMKLERLLVDLECALDSP